jgi:hypothetical protein
MYTTGSYLMLVMLASQKCWQVAISPAYLRHVYAVIMDRAPLIAVFHCRRRRYRPSTLHQHGSSQDSKPSTEMTDWTIHLVHISSWGMCNMSWIQMLMTEWSWWKVYTILNQAIVHSLYNPFCKTTSLCFSFSMHFWNCQYFQDLGSDLSVLYNSTSAP